MNGPFFSLRGLTNSQINTDHAFLVLLTFKLQYDTGLRNLRNLEEDKIVKTYCQIVESCDKTNEEPNIADFDCIGDVEEEGELNGYNLESIQESPENNNTGVFERSNLDNLVKYTDLSALGEKIETTFKLENYLGLVIFNFNETKNITSKDYNFDFTLNGKLNKKLKEDSIDVEIPINQILNYNVTCKFNIKANQNANLKCNFNLEKYKNDFKEFSLKVTEVSDSSENPIFLSRINEIKLIHEDNDEDDDDDNNAAVIIICVVASIVVAGVGIGVGVYFYKIHKIKKLKKNNLNYSSVKNKSHSSNYKVYTQESHRKVIPFHN